MDLEQDPDFLAYVKDNNVIVSSELFEQIKAQIYPAFLAMVADMELAVELAVQKAQQDAANGIFYYESTENLQPSTTTTDHSKAPNSATKQGRAHTGQAAPGKAVKPSVPKEPVTKKKPAAAAAERPPHKDNDTAEPCAKAKQKKDPAEPIPKGQVRIEVVGGSEAG